MQRIRRPRARPGEAEATRDVPGAEERRGHPRRHPRTTDKDLYVAGARTMPSHEEAIEKATLLMRSFAERTGLTSDRPKQRYLWTDAFAVCNFLGLARMTGERSYADLALRLVDQVHHVLGRYRADDTRTGWISGLGEREGESHPTCGGLRIGKALAIGGPSFTL